MSLNNAENNASNSLAGTNSDSGSVSLLTHHSLRIPQFWPHKIVLWFRLLEAQFASARITSDETKFNITIANLGEKYIEQVEDVVINPPVTEQYEHLKREVIKRLTESDGTRVRKLLESEEIGDRTPSQFFRDLKKLATPSVPDEFILTLWKNRLPPNTQRVLAATTDSNITVLTEMADRIHEIRPEQGRLPAVHMEPANSELAEIREQLKKLQDQIAAMSVKPQRRPFTRSGQRSRSRSREKGGLCWYHANYKMRAAKCVAPCSWNSGNEKSRP